MKYIYNSGFKVLKTVVATVIAIEIAKYFGMRYYLTAGIVAIISLQSTLKGTYKVAIERILATTIGLVISSLLFYFFGFGIWVLGLFILIFMPICLKFNLVQGFLVNIVLATHFISEESVTTELFFNEFGILLIGLITAILFNLYMPNLNKDIEAAKRDIGKEIQKILFEMANLLKTKTPFQEGNIDFTNLKIAGSKGKKLSLEQHNNSIFASELENSAYFRMRYIQYKILKRMKLNFKRISYFPEQGVTLAYLIEKMSSTTFSTASIYEELNEIEKTKIELRNNPLPKTREEFESRAILYGFFVDLEEFATVALEFIESYPKATKSKRKGKL